MKTIVGLDLGANSLGWALVSPDNKKILDTGVRIFPAGVNEKTIGQGEREQSKNAERREHRLMRRMIFRKKIRKIKLLELLIQYGMCPLSPEELKKWKNWDPGNKTKDRKFPTSEAFNHWLQMNPYELRHKAVHDTITLEEFGRILYHMIQRRGFRSTRKGKSDDQGKIFEGERGINNLKEQLNDRTLGEYLYEISHKEKEPYRFQHEKTTGYRVRNRYTLREMYVEEFEKIWEKQANHLGLDKKQYTLIRRRYLKGSPENKKNRQKIENLRKKHGPENVKIEGHLLETRETLPLKKALAGENRYENGKIRFNSDNSVLFWQRPLRSQKALLNECRYERTVKDDRGRYILRGRKPCPVSHPDFELFRSWQFVNNIFYGKNQPLTPEQKLEVITLLDKKEKLKFKEIPKMLGLSWDKFNYEDDMVIPGNKTTKKLKPLFPEEIWKVKKYEIWHSFYFYEDNDLLFEKLKKEYSLLTADPQKINKIRLDEGYGSLSLKAILNILPYLQKGMKYSHAVILGGVRSAFGLRWEYFKDFHEEIEENIRSIIFSGNTEGETIRRIRDFLTDPANDFGFTKDDARLLRLYHPSQEVIKKQKRSKLSPIENLRNPIVQQGLNEMRRVVNTLLERYRTEYGKDFEFDEIHVEFARELKISKQQRADMTRRIRENEAKNKDAREVILRYGLRPSRENIQKYLLYQEIEERAGRVQCPYTGMTINIHDLLGEENRIQIEHIIPRSISLDDSFGNKTLCESNFNRKKGELTPYEFYRKNPDTALWGASSWEEVEQRAFKLLSYAKAKRFVTRKDFTNETIREGFIERQLNDTRYMSKKAASILTEICDHIQVMPGGVTAEMRHLWGLNNLLSETTLPLQERENLPDTPTPYHVFLDKKGEPVKVQRIKNEKPTTHADEILLPGECINGRFIARHKTWHQEWPAPCQKNGKYWMKIRIHRLAGIYPVFREKPESAEEEVVLSGPVSRKRFSHNSLKRPITVATEDGKYWARLPVLKKTFLPGDERPEKTKNNVLTLFGHIKDNFFQSYIYTTRTEEPAGPAWIILHLELDRASFIPQTYQPPTPAGNQIIVEGTVNDAGTFVPELDKDFSFDTEVEKGRYWAVFDMDTDANEWFPMENPKQAEKGQKVIEGDLWVDKNTEEIRFDPKKSRDDHRHHAIDAITIALITRSHLQRLSTYNARMKEFTRSSGDRPYFDMPWKGFNLNVKEDVDNILVSFRQNKHILTRISKQIIKEGRTLKARGMAARGQLHRETFFGKRKSPDAGQHYYHVRKEITSIENNKHVDKIVDPAIKQLIRNKLREMGINPNKSYKIPSHFFFNEKNEPQLFLPNRNGDPVPIRKVRMRENIGNAVPLKQDFNIWVNPYNNHHVMIYLDKEDTLRESIVTFWEAVRRLQNKERLYRLPDDGKEIITTLQENDMFLLGFPGKPEEIAHTPPRKLSPYLYRVQKISSMYYTFRHHRAANIEDDTTELNIRSFSAWQKYHPLKVKITEDGQL